MKETAKDLLRTERADENQRLQLATSREPGNLTQHNSRLRADVAGDKAVTQQQIVPTMDDLTQFMECNPYGSDLKAAERIGRSSPAECELRLQELTYELGEVRASLFSELAERQLAEDAFRYQLRKMELFAYSIVHDLKNPAMAIRGFAKLLRKQYGKALGEQGGKYCDLIMSASEHLWALAEDLNSYVAAKQSPPKIERIDTKEILQRIKDEFSGLIGFRCIAWVTPESGPVVMADGTGILRAFRNFVDNSLKYGGEGLSEIRIDYSESEEHHVFSFRDDGLGITKGDSQKVFEPFHRGSRSKNCPGTGLGLTIAKEIAERHGGKVWLEGSPEKGTSFCFSISKGLKPGSQSDYDAED